MMHRRPVSNTNLTPEQLTAYADGELAPAERQRLEAWLADHAEARQEVQDYRELDRLYRETPPPEPTESRWAEALTAIEQRVAAARSAAPVPVLSRPGLWRAVRWMGLTAASLAACVVILVYSQQGRQSTPTAAVEPLPVASDHDVEILSIDDADAITLPVGKLPVEGPLILASGGDIVLESVHAASDGMVPTSLGMGEGQSTPMIVAPLEPAP